MTFRGQPYAFESPAAAVAGMVDALGPTAPGRVERVPLHAARGRYLAEPARLDRDSPPFDTAVMDGFAIRCADLVHAGDGELAVQGESMIGRAPPPLVPGTAMRIATGAAMPAGADTVLPREVVQEAMEGGTPRAITIDAEARAAVQPGHHIRLQGENARAGATVLRAADALHAASLGTLAAIGLADPLVRARVRVAIVTTGEEIVAPGESPAPFELRDSNGPAVEAALASHAWVEVAWRRHARGDHDELDAPLASATQACDALVLTGGISMGHRDPVRAAIERTGARVVFHGLPQRPGKPMLGAVVQRRDGAPCAIFGLPGNPLSALVTLARVAMPVLAHLGGGGLAARPLVRLANPDGQSLPMWCHRLVHLTSGGEAELVPVRSSGDVVAGGAGDGFIEVPPGTAPASHGPFTFHAWPR